jgi:hypothetical protein
MGPEQCLVWPDCFPSILLQCRHSIPKDHAPCTLPLSLRSIISVGRARNSWQSRKSSFGNSPALQSEDPGVVPRLCHDSSTALAGMSLVRAAAGLVYKRAIKAHCSRLVFQPTHSQTTKQIPSSFSSLIPTPSSVSPYFKEPSISSN